MTCAGRVAGGGCGDWAREAWGDQDVAGAQPAAEGRQRGPQGCAKEQAEEVRGPAGGALPPLCARWGWREVGLPAQLGSRAEKPVRRKSNKAQALSGPLAKHGPAPERQQPSDQAFGFTRSEAQLLSCLFRKLPCKHYQTQKRGLGTPPTGTLCLSFHKSQLDTCFGMKLVASSAGN
ncbi:Homeobox Protein Hox-A6 [Manis pentadactyla]|nr:Homeobox Protein Hox-A6 [Manis pentadactyla]